MTSQDLANRDKKIDLRIGTELMGWTELGDHVHGSNLGFATAVSLCDGTIQSPCAEIISFNWSPSTYVDTAFEAVEKLRTRRIRPMCFRLTSTTKRTWLAQFSNAGSELDALSARDRSPAKAIAKAIVKVLEEDERWELLAHNGRRPSTQSGEPCENLPAK